MQLNCLKQGALGTFNKIFFQLCLSGHCPNASDLTLLGIDSASPEMRMRLSSALDENERLDNELVGQLVQQSRVKSAATSPLKSHNTIEVRE